MIGDITHDMLIRYTQIDYDREIAIIAEHTDSEGKKRRYLKGCSSGMKVDGHGERMTKNCIKNMQEQAKSGNILLYAIGKGFHNLHVIDKDSFIYGDLIDRLKPEDCSILHKWRLMNLRKLYPYIPIAINDILLHFSKGAELFYESVDEVLEDLNSSL